jgi:acyl-CoA reductase-like NAD-dependent aldehyde dehydrogenase
MANLTQKTDPFGFATFGNIIDGNISFTEVTRHGTNPATLQPNPEVPISTKSDVDITVAAARCAFVHWSKTPPANRKKAVLAYADGLNQYKTEFAALLTQEQGKPVCVRDKLTV